jgi:hypothetical protein
MHASKERGYRRMAHLFADNEQGALIRSVHSNTILLLECGRWALSMSFTSMATCYKAQRNKVPLQPMINKYWLEYIYIYIYHSGTAKPRKSTIQK